MKPKLLFIFGIVIMLAGCDEKVVYKDDPELYFDASHGAIVGKIIQTGVNARVFVKQGVPIDSTDVDLETGSFRIEDLPIGNYDLTIESDSFRTYTYFNVLVKGAGNTYIGEVDLSTIPDLVAYHSPADLDELVSNTGSRLSVSISFTQPMDRESIEEAFSTIPDSEGIFQWGQYVYTPRDDNKNDYSGAGIGSSGGSVGATITTFSKVTAFTYQMAQKDSYTDTTYTVTLSTAAQDTAGNHLRFPLEFSFSTVQASSTIDGVQSIPSHGDINVGLISNNGMQVIFPRNMNQESTEASISITPEMEHIFIWPGNNSLTIYTGGPYMAETDYMIQIDGDAEDLDGVALGEDFSFSFSTEAVKITRTQPKNGELFVQYMEPYVTFWFNTYMIKSTVEEAFSIDPHVSGKIQRGGKKESNSNNTTLTFLPGEPLIANKKYTVTIGTEAKDLYGAGLKEPYTFSFVTRPE